MPESKDLSKRFTWNIHYECNFRCPYCFFEGRWVEYKKRNVHLSVEEWMDHWNRIYNKYGRCYILITGGEPFIYPGFIRLMEELSRVHYPINISTNASGDLETFVKKIDPARVSLSVSLQLHFEKVEPFLEKVKFLRKHKFDGCINFVAYPPFISQVESLVKRFDSIGEKLKVIPFWGKYQEKEYPFSYTQEEKDILGISDSWFDNARKKNSSCPAGYNSALMFPDGKVARCGQVGERVLVGNFFDSEFGLLDKPLACDAEFCPCDEGRLFGDNEEKNTLGVNTSCESRDKVKGTELNAVSNSLLNDNEYNARKVILRSSPKAIFIQAAGPCNSSCVFCSRGHDYEIFNLREHRRLFENNLYPHIARAQNLILTGSGEFLMLPNAKEILDFFDIRFPETAKCFSTNGSLFSPGVCESILEGRSNYTIHISLHASYAGLHNVVTRMNNFDDIIKQAKHLISRRKNNKKPQINLIFVATTLNIEDFPDFVRLAADVGADKVICYYNFIYIPTQKYLSCFFRQEFTNKIFDKAQSLADKLKIQVDLPFRFGHESSSCEIAVCREPFSQIMLDSQGKVLPCDAAEDCPEALDETKDFMDVWNSLYYQRLRQALIDKEASCSKHCLRVNPGGINNFKSHVIYRGGRKDEDIHILWGDNF